MNEEKRISGGSRVFLVGVGVIADGAKIALDFFFGIGFILDPFLISPVTWFVFWLVLLENKVPMMSGKRGWMGWTNLIVAETPGIDVLPDWTIFALCV